MTTFKLIPLSEKPFPNSIHMSRLSNLLTLLKTIPDDQFDIGSWVAVGGYIKYSKYPSAHPEILNQLCIVGDVNDIKPIELPCGTTACAIGYATMHPWFQNQGLMFRPEGEIGYKPPNEPMVYGFTAISRFFNIPLSAAFELFSRDYYISNAPVTVDRVVAKMRLMFPELESL